MLAPEVDLLSINYMIMQGKSYAKRIEELKADVRAMLDKAVVMDPLHQFELRDALQRLGVSYHFGDEIKKLLNAIYRNNNLQKQESLYAVALEFRLLRQHGYDTATTASKYSIEILVVLIWVVHFCKLYNHLLKFKI